MTNPAEAGLYLWILSFLFWLGVLLVPLGLFLITFPAAAMRLAIRVNRWISTKSAFDFLNRPRYQERAFYRHHRLFGSLIVIFSVFCIYMLGIYLGEARLMNVMHRLTSSEFGRWLILDLYYILLAGLVISLVTGIVILVRPSVLKNLEAKANRWLNTDTYLETFDRVHELPVRMLPWRLRLLGVFVLIGAGYMIYATGGAIY